MTACIHYQKEEGTESSSKDKGRVREQEGGRSGQHRKKGEEERAVDIK